MEYPCAGCPYVKDGTCKSVVSGHGQPGGIFICGEAPGGTEARMKLPFVGPSGKMLREVIQKAGIKDPLYFGNATICWPGQVQPPTQEHITACRSRLLAEIERVKPHTILALGATALRSLMPELKKSETISRVHGKFFDTPLGRILPTFHPAYIMRNQSAFKEFAKDICMLSPDFEPEVIPLPQIVVIDSAQDMARFNARKPKPSPTGYAVCDLETTGLDETDPDGKITCVGLCFDIHTAYVISDVALESPYVRTSLKLLLENQNYHWTNHNAVFDYQWIKAKLGIDWVYEFDTFLASFALDERRGTHGLKALSKEYFGAGDYGKEAKENEFWRDPSAVGREKLYEYCGYDVVYTHRLRTALTKEMERENVQNVHDTVLLPLARVLSDISRTGIMIDVPYFEKLAVDLEQEIAETLQKLRDVAENPTFNPGSWQQVKKLFVEKLQIMDPASKTDEESLMVVQEAHPDNVAVSLLLRYRQLTKVRSTYVVSLLEKVGPDGRIHANFHIDGTSTGRISASKPSLQNIPKDMGPLIRNGFVATPGWKFCEIDLSQAELRVLALRSGDKALLRAFQDDSTDIHRQVASIMFKIPYTDVTPLQRKAGKTLGFAIIYGRGVKSIAADLNETEDVAYKMREDFFNAMPRVRAYITERHKFVREHQYSITSFGRKRRFPCLTTDMWDQIKRESFNAEIQGTAADVCQMALVRLHNSLDPNIARIVATVHDSILVEYRPDHEEEVLAALHREMEYPILGPEMRFKADSHTGYRWGDLVDH